MTHCELLGWCASALMLSATLCRREGLIRCLAIATNLTFIGFANATGVFSVMTLHAVLLVINTARLAALFRRSAAGPSPPANLLCDRAHIHPTSRTAR